VIKKEVAIIGGGPAGLAAAYELTKHGHEVVVAEEKPQVGGLARTVHHKGFRFDIGPHRWFTKNEELNDFMRSLLGDKLLRVPRLTRIYFNNRFFDYPLKPANALFGMGLIMAAKIVADYAAVRIAPLRGPVESFEDWTIRQFGRTMYNLYFKSYTEKVWGIPCNQISADWASQRIKGLSLASAVKSALLKNRMRGKIKSLIDEFMYPMLGAGLTYETMKAAIEERNQVLTQTRVVSVNRDGRRINSITAKTPTGPIEIEAEHFISSIPLTEMVLSINPPPPPDVVQAAKSLRHRDHIVVALMINRPQLTKDTWIYIQEPGLKAARMYEPKNCSPHMVPSPDVTSLGVEYYCFEGDEFWRKSDDELVEFAVKEVVDTLHFFDRPELIDGFVIRSRMAYPLVEKGYHGPLQVLKQYVKTLENLQIIGRCGTFRYNNQDHAIETGFLAARNLMGGNYDIDRVNADGEYLEEKVEETT
jgi:protoporphyrinogen oxidase